MDVKQKSLSEITDKNWAFGFFSTIVGKLTHIELPEYYSINEKQITKLVYKTSDLLRNN